MLRAMSSAERLTMDLERLALLAAGRSYDDINGTYFRWKLTRPTLRFVDGTSKLGLWDRRTREIALARSLLFEHGWGVLVEVLKHEITHQYVDEVLGVADESSHGPTFRRVCEERGFDARAAGVPEAREDSPILDRIAKLLALAESPNEHEAQAAMSAAQRLMLKYNIDAVSAGTHAAYTYRHLGRPTGRVLENQRILAALLGQHFFVSVIWVSVWQPLSGKYGQVLEVCGSLENVELAEYAHSFLAHTADRLWRDHKRLHRIRNDAGRQSFLTGVMSGFREKLERERSKNASEGLVFVGDPGQETYFRQRHPRIRTVNHRARVRTDAYASGREAGRNIVLHRGVRSSASDSGPRLLSSKS
jgi:hypothetical protein